MKEIRFNPPTAEHIEVRPTDTKYKGKCTLLLYIDSRSAADIMNGAVGPMNWQIEYKDVAGIVYGRLSVWDDNRQMFIYKEDTGSESNIEATKGQSSDILKRCIARWGCDYLYHTPQIRIDCPDNYYWNGKLNMTFSVKEIEFEGKECTRLVLVDKFGNVVYTYGVPTAIQKAVAAAGTVDELKAVWNKNKDYQKDAIFKNLVNGRKKVLAN